MKKISLFFAAVIVLTLFSCEESLKADLLIINGQYYSGTVTENIDCLALNGEKIIFVGQQSEVKDFIGENTRTLDANGLFVMPGFIEGHGHFSGMGNTLQNLNFLKDTSWTQIIAKVKEKVATAEKGEWIYGRGWHQEKWSEQPLSNYGGFPIHYERSDSAPDNPVMLIHASGHSLFANEKAMSLAGINKETPSPNGGKIIKTGSDEVIAVSAELQINKTFSLGLSSKKSVNQSTLASSINQLRPIKFSICSQSVMSASLR